MDRLLILLRDYKLLLMQNIKVTQILNKLMIQSMSRIIKGTNLPENMH
jgi:hypothetical protein